MIKKIDLKKCKKQVRQAYFFFSLFFASRIIFSLFIFLFLFTELSAKLSAKSSIQTPLSSQRYIGKQLVIIDSVVDMDTQLPSQAAQKQVLTLLPVCSDTKQCFRSHQGLFNELVTCIGEHGDHVQIAYDVDNGSKIVYGFCKNTQKPLSMFWIKKEHVFPVHQIQDKEVRKVIPVGEYAGKPTIVLMYPWKNFSVGTRFFHNAVQDKSDLYCVQRPNYEYIQRFNYKKKSSYKNSDHKNINNKSSDYKTKLLITDYIPKKYALREMPLKHESLMRLRFVKLTNQLVDLVGQLSSGMQIIPYVWGGSSFIRSHLKDESDFYLQDGVWHRQGVADNKLYTGYDCSGFIMRMAKIAGINFPWKTSWVMQEKKRALTEKDILEDGDIIWIPGHVMVVSDMKNNELIEARGYGSGFGCVHRIKVSAFFDGIDTYQELLAAYQARKKIKYKDKNGVVSNKECEFKLLKLID